ncbi:unnamed protein product, partial [Dicrocoelium dendriticum]
MAASNLFTEEMLGRILRTYCLKSSIASAVAIRSVSLLIKDSSTSNSDDEAHTPLPTVSTVVVLRSDTVFCRVHCTYVSFVHKRPVVAYV